MAFLNSMEIAHELSVAAGKTLALYLGNYAVGRFTAFDGLDIPVDLKTILFVYLILVVGGLTIKLVEKI